MRRFVIQAALVACFAFLAGGCAGDDEEAQPGPETATSETATTEYEPATLTLWTYWTGREKKAVDANLDEFEKQYPGLTVKHVGGVTEPQRVLAAVTAGKPPDVWQYWDTSAVDPFCEQGALSDLKPYIERDKLDLSIFHPFWLQYMERDGKQCALPQLGDTYGLYYNKDLFEKAGLTDPPKTTSELTEYAKKLTEFNPDGSIKVAGYVPVIYYNQYIEHLASMFDADWLDSEGKSAFGSDPDWVALMEWQKELVDWYGYDKLQKFVSGFADEFSASHAGETGKVALWEDGEWRVAFIADEHPELNYGTAPLPVSDDHPELYGAGLLNTNPVVVPTNAPHPDEAWLLLRFMTTDVDSLVALANLVKNIPNIEPAIESPEFSSEPLFQTFLDIYNHGESRAVPAEVFASQALGLVSDLNAKWVAGEITDLQDALEKIAEQADRQMAQGG